MDAYRHTSMHHIHKCIHKYAHTQFPRIRQHITFRVGLHTVQYLIKIMGPVYDAMKDKRILQNMNGYGSNKFFMVDMTVRQHATTQERRL